MPSRFRFGRSLSLLLTGCLSLSTFASTYTWKASVADGDWANAANWESSDGGATYPSSSSDTAIFADTAAHVVTLGETAITIGTLNLSAENVSVTLTGAEGASTNDAKLVVSTAANISGKGLTLKLDHAALSVTASKNATLGENGTLELVNGADLYVGADFDSTAKGGRVLLSGDSVLNCKNRYRWGNENNLTVIDDSQLRAQKTVRFYNTGGKIRFAGTHPLLYSQQYFVGAANTASGTVEFVIPSGGYTDVPVQCSAGNTYRLGTEYMSATLYFSVASDSPAKQNVETLTTTLVYWPKNGILRTVATEGALPQATDAFVWSAETNPLTLGVSLSGSLVMVAEVVENGAWKAFDLTLPTSAIDRDLYVVWGATDAGTTPENWTHREATSFATVKAGETAATFSLEGLSDAWGSDNNKVLRFYYLENGARVWSEAVNWRDLSALAFEEGISLDGTGGDTIKVGASLKNFVGESCALKVLVGTTEGVFDRVFDAGTVAQGGAFEVSVCETDATKTERCLLPGTTYYVCVEATVGDQTARSDVGTVKMSGAPTWKSAPTATTPTRKDVTITGQLSDVGMGGETVVTLWYKENDAEEWTQATDAEGNAVTKTVADTDAFTISFGFPACAKTYVWQLRTTNVSVGKTATTSESQDGKAAVVTKDVTTYTWKGTTSADAPGAWEDATNWRGEPSDGCFGYPNSADATAVFPAGTTANITLETTRTIGTLNLSAENVSVTLTGAAGVSTNDAKLVVSTLANISGKSLSLKLDHAALSVTTSSGATIGENGTLELVNGADLSVSGNLSNTAKGGRVLLSGDSVLYSFRYIFGNEDNQTVIDDSLLLGGRTFEFQNAGGKVLFKGTHPQMFANQKPGNLFGADNASATLEFEVPEEGYAIPPVRCVEGNNKELGNEAFGTYAYNGAKLYVNVSANSPAKQRGRQASARLVDWSTGIHKDVLKEGTLPGKSDLFVWKDKDGNETDADLPVSLDVQFTNSHGLMLIIR